MHTITKKIYYYDTDSGGVVYYANYLKYFEEARTEFFVSLGFDIKALSRQGFLFVVKSVNIEYLKPGKYGDKLLIESWALKVRNVSIDFEQVVKRGDEHLAKAVTRLVCVGSDFRPRAMPQELSCRLENSGIA
ncbi:MAG: YbgC/FadM family acyl-CoA thioesterase [Candidatus Omnitrophica bacterium]|nr:YbgC/FadM family acyl-CoA thioesterase [Candidatus Omnitrophota bacterium]MDD5429574.1 YbgC/FadM family acyl-CoA thioesterase [Candidatus Omnitrophota bacterium]